MPSTRTFVTVCKEGDIIFWQISDERKVNKILNLKAPQGKRIKTIHIVAKAYHRHDPNVLNDRIIMVFKSGESELFDFEIGGKTERVKGEVPPQTNAHLFLLENEKQKEHDCKVSGVDSNKYARLIVTSDSSGTIKIWSLEKRFLREIQFPHPIDSVCFLNE